MRFYIEQFTGQRRLIDWLAANGIDAGMTPRDAVLDIDYEARTISTEQHVKDKHDRVVIHRGEVLRLPVTFPLVADIPEELR